jgi:hypothetical protein
MNHPPWAIVQPKALLTGAIMGMGKLRIALKWLPIAAFALAGTLFSPFAAADTITLEEGAIIRLAREAVLNGVTMAKGTELKVAGLKRDERGIVVRIDLQQVGGEHKLFKALTPDAVAAMTSQSGGPVQTSDKAAMFKVAAQIPILRDLVLGDVVFPKGSTLQIVRLQKDNAGKVNKIDLRETSGQKRLLRGVPVEQLLFALSPEDVTWPDGAVGRQIELGADLTFGGQTFVKGTKFVVTRVEIEPKNHEVVKVDLRETGAQKRELASVSVAVLKRNGALGTSAGSVR